MQALRQVDGWPCTHAAVAVIGAAVGSHGSLERSFPWASVTKLATAVAVLVAAEEGSIDLDELACIEIESSITAAAWLGANRLAIGGRGGTMVIEFESPLTSKKEVAADA